MTHDPGYDPLGPDALADPMGATAPLRAGCPVHRFDGFEPPFYTLSRHEDVLDALKDVETFSSRYGQGPHVTEERGMKSDPPTHTFFRRLVSKAFTARAVREMEGRIEEIVGELLDAFADRGEGDLHEHLAFPLPTIVIAEMLGVPESDRSRFKGWSDAWVAAMSAVDPTPYEPEIASMRAYILDAVHDRRALEKSGRTLPDDLISALVSAEENGERLRDEDVVNVVRQLLVGGNETTTSLITNVLLRLMQEPTLMARIVADPTLAEVAVEESLRHDAPVLGLFRTTTCPVRRDDTVIPAGAKVMLHFGSANHDEQAFTDPDAFSLDRDPQELRKHLAFGHGIHVCLGAALSRLEGTIALREVARRLPGLALAGTPERIEPFMLWGRSSLPARWDVPDGPAAAAASSPR
ncbi:cytochrome P450 [Nocardioides hwasunensis]|uniref:Cytochrome P450 n=1 Tax=Nocardioides hwasunensis TaxID=397258 RepID=A0ABR8MQC0_9ACTN|nr:cytochrome P450 [Nocardioides hwasunensis]MBD3916754.1 cytochrome P450 [Nocardioides hwasunensis]